MKIAQSGSRGFFSPSPHTTRHAGPHRAVHREDPSASSGRRSRVVNVNPQLFDRQKPLILKPFVGHARLRRQRPG